MSKICQPGFNLPSIIRYSIKLLQCFACISKSKRIYTYQTAIHISTEDNDTLHAQIVEPALGFTLAEICHALTEPTLTVQELLEIESCKDYIKTPLQTLNGIYVNQPKRFLPLAKEVKKLAEEFQKEEIASQWAGLPPEKLLQESFVEELDALQSLE